MHKRKSFEIPLYTFGGIDIQIGVIRCESHKEAEWMMERLEERLKICKLEVSPEKMRIIYN